MYHTETLNTRAEISITLVSFPGIVVIFGNRFVRGWTKKEALQFVFILGLLQQISIGVINFVLLFKPVNENSIA